MDFENNLKTNNLVLPNAMDPVGSYVATKLTNNLLYVSGQISIDENGNLIKGKVGKDLNTEEGYKAAERCALSILSQAKKALDNECFVNSTDIFTDQPKVINGASDTIVKVLGDCGMHTRAAVSVNSLPLGVAVEVDAIFEIK